MSEYVWYSPYHDQLFVCGADECKEFDRCEWTKCPCYFFDPKRSVFKTSVTACSAVTYAEKLVFDERYFIGEL